LRYGKFIKGAAYILQLPKTKTTTKFFGLACNTLDTQKYSM